MAATHSNPKTHLAFALLNNLFGTVTGARPFLELMKDLMTKQADKMLRRILSLAVIYFTMLAGIIILTSGVVLLIVDFTTIPRGVAFTLGGLVLISGSALVMQLSKK
jgi:hypothetical protein